MRDFIRINNASDLPKYKQIIDNIINNIEQGKLKRGEQLPSIAALSASQKIAKVTIAKAYEILREQGLILSRHGKGFYVASNEVKVKLNIFILFDTFNAYKEILYNAFKEALPPNTHCSIFFHHYDITQFRNHIKNSVGKYNYYVIMPHFDEDVSKIINLIPKEKLLLIDKDVANLKGDYSAVYQDFEPDVFNALQQGLQLLKKYKSLQLIVGREHFQYVPSEILKGFTKFCKKHAIHSAIQENLVEKNIKQHHAYFIFSDSDLIRLIKFCNSKKWKLGKDIGLISYDETPMKEILSNGVTVISTDFKYMGLKAAELILEKKKEKVPNSAGMIIRKTL
ncbi:MAG: GntR family transcriptional regulator [Parafilimonas sp.]